MAESVTCRHCGEDISFRPCERRGDEPTWMGLNEWCPGDTSDGDHEPHDLPASDNADDVRRWLQT